MDRKKWKEYRRNWRSVRSSLYEDESPIPYTRRLEIEAHFSLARKCSPSCNYAYNLLFMWEIGQRARKRALEEDFTFDPEWVANAARSYMRRNTKCSGRELLGRSYPAGWFQYDTVK